jgi:hypothetical protein
MVSRGPNCSWQSCAANIRSSKRNRQSLCASHHRSYPTRNYFRHLIVVYITSASYVAWSSQDRRQFAGGAFVSRTERVSKGKSHASNRRSQEKRPRIDRDRADLRVCAGRTCRSLATAWSLAVPKEEVVSSSSSYTDELLFFARNR